MKRFIGFIIAIIFITNTAYAAEVPRESVALHISDECIAMQK